MFDKDFYPTPPEVLDMIGIDCADKIIFEPSAGSGNIIDWCKLHGAKEVLSCEKNSDLAEIVKSKSDKFLGYDFLKVKPDQISHVHSIIMNPPFSAGVKHVLHAWEIAPGGCEIISLINQDNLSDYTRERRELVTLIENYGQNDSLGDVFTTAERKTGVEVGLIKLYKPQDESREFDGFFMYEDEEQQGTGIMEFNVVREIVQRYVNCVKKFEQVMALAAEMTALAGPLSSGTIVCNMGYKEGVVTKEDYKKQLQKNAWSYLFNKMNLNKYVTSGVMRDINKFVENQTKVPFTMKNVYKMFEIIVGTREQTFNKSLVEAIDKFTEHTHENRYNVEGWKTNAGHLLNKKFITGWMVSPGYSSNGYLTLRHGSNADRLEDLVKVICANESFNFDELPRLYNHISDIKMEPNTWYEWGFFEIKGFKKGTMHLKFKDHDVWARLNQKYAKIKGEVLPEKTWK